LKPVIVLAHFFPFPAQVGAEIRTNFVVKALSKITDVILIAPLKSGADIEEAKRYCKEIYQVKSFSESKIARILRRVKEPFVSFPAAGRHLNIREFKKNLYSLEKKYDDALLWLEAVWLMESLDNNDKRKVVLNQHNLDSAVIEKRCKNTNFPLNILLYNDFIKQRKFERNNLKRAYKIFSVSEEEKENHLKLFGDLKIDVLPNAVEIEKYPLLLPNIASQTITMTGDFGYTPNVEGFYFFLNNIFDKIKKELNGIKVVVAGRKSQDIKVHSEDVILYGEFKEPSEVYKKTTVSIAPILTGGGSRYKIIESLAFGIPVVSTKEGAEGLDIRDGEGVFIGNDPKDFAKKVIELLKNAELAKESGTKGRKTIEEKYSFKSVMQSFEKSVEEILR